MEINANFSDYYKSKLLTKLINHMFKKISLLILLVLPIIVVSQVRYSKDFKITKGRSYKVVDASSKLYFPINEEKVVSVKTSGEEVTLQLYDAKKMLEITRHEYDDFPKYSKVQDIITAGGKLYYVFEAFNKSNDNFSVYIREINTSDATFGKIRKLFTTKDVVVGTFLDPLEDTKAFNFPGAKHGPKFKVYSSFDGSKIMIGYRNKPKVKSDKKNKDIIGMYVFDNEFNLLWGKEEQMPYTEANMDNLAYGVSKDGVAFTLIYLRNEKKYSMLTFAKDRNFKELKLDIDGLKLLQKLEMAEDEKGNIIFAGFYANGIDFKMSWSGAGALAFNTNGIIYFEMNREGEIVNSYDYPFSIDFINQYQSKNQKKKANKREADDKAGIMDLKMLEFEVNDDGSVIFMGEQRYMRTELYGPKQKLVYHYAHVVLAKVDNEGELLWMVKLPKNQAGVAGRAGLGAKYIKGHGKHYLLYLDNEDNANIKISDATKPYKDGQDAILTAYVVDDKTAEVEKHSLVSLDNIYGVKAYQFKTGRIFNLDENTAMLEIYIKDKKDTMIKFEMVDK